jgi:ATP-binding protein involved in chromosome partitioning
MLHKALTSFVTEVFWDEPDYLLVDLPPGTGDVSISIAQLLPTASVVLVTTPPLLAQGVARRAAAMASRVNLPVIGVVENMSYFIAPDTGTRYDVFGGGGGTTLAAELGVPLLGQVPLEPAVATAGDAGLPVLASHPDSPAARALEAVAGAVATALPVPILTR